ncbi:hypothetical protein [Bradyrhizobium sp. LTSP857]|uniref:hypothetical protein n=1 Tax=Bradyrhizobium sp. LTSP857 TaxID=1619231 RepID=UPI0005D285EC|nr:hypothetical protein [Bradyrhizobium sp. LTSP857]
MGLLPQTFVFVVRRKPIRTEGLKVICDLAKPRLLQPDIVAAISAFGAMGRIQNVKNNPMHSSRQGQSEVRGERWIADAVAGTPSKYLI